MNFLKLLASHLLNIFIPEEARLQEILKLDSSEIRNIFPKSETVKDRDIFPIFNYRNKGVKTAVWALKYRAHPIILQKFAEILYEEIIVASPATRVALIPIPMSSKRRRDKGFNQCELLCEEVRKLSRGEIKVLDILEKIKNHDHQTGLSREKRLANIKGSMRIKNENYKLKIENSIPIIIDDVYTTGATVTEARRALSEAGIHNTLAITLAH